MSSFKLARVAEIQHLDVPVEQDPTSLRAAVRKVFGQEAEGDFVVVRTDQSSLTVKFLTITPRVERDVSERDAP